MRLKPLLWTVVVLIIWVGCLVWCQRVDNSVVDPQTARQKFILGSSFSSPIKQWRRYEWRISGRVELRDGKGDEQNAPVVVISGTMWFGGDAKQKLLHYEWVLGPYSISIDRLQEDNNVYIRSASVLISGAVDNSFVQSLLGRLNNTQGGFVYLRGLVPTHRINLVATPQYIFTLLRDYITLDIQYCTAKKCQIIIDTDLVNTRDQSQVATTQQNKLLEWVGWVHKQAIFFYPKQAQLELVQLSTLWKDLQAKLTNDNLSVNYVTRWVTKRVYSIQHNVVSNVHTIDLELDQDGETLQSRRGIYEVYPDGWNMSVASMLSGIILDLQGERFDKGAYLPVDKWTPEDVYGLLGR